MRAYMHPMLQVNSVPVVEAQAIDVDPPAPEPIGEETEQDKIAAALARWPSIARHRLRVGVGMALCDTHGIACERAGVVVYDTSEDEDKKGERE